MKKVKTTVIGSYPVKIENMELMNKYFNQTGLDIIRVVLRNLFKLLIHWHYRRRKHAKWIPTPGARHRLFIQ